MPAGSGRCRNDEEGWEGGPAGVRDGFRLPSREVTVDEAPAMLIWHHGAFSCSADDGDVSTDRIGVRRTRAQCAGGAGSRRGRVIRVGYVGGWIARTKRGAAVHRERRHGGLAPLLDPDVRAGHVCSDVLCRQLAGLERRLRKGGVGGECDRKCADSIMTMIAD
eukprot:scaffold28520_cov124-Isochrysis_galbana.AAC.6